MEAPEEWANATNFMMSGLGFSVEEPEITTNFRDLRLIVCENNWEKRILRYTKMVTEQLKALILGFCEVTNYQNTQWAERFESWPLSTIRVHLKGLAESGGFLEIQ